MITAALAWLGGLGGKALGLFGKIPSAWLLYAALIGLLFWSGYAVGARHVEARISEERKEEVASLMRKYNEGLAEQARQFAKNQADAIANAEARATREAEARAAVEILAARAAAGITDNRQCDIPASVMDAINEAGGLPQ